MFQDNGNSETVEGCYEIEKTIMVPDHAMGKVIGKCGARIDSLANQHMCDLKMLRDEACANGDTPLKIKSLRGVLGDVLAAEKDIKIIVSEMG